MIGLVIAMSVATADADDAWAAYRSCIRDEAARLIEAAEPDEVVFSAPEACVELRQAAIDQLVRDSTASKDGEEISQLADGLIGIDLADILFERDQAAQAKSKEAE